MKRATIVLALLATFAVASVARAEDHKIIPEKLKEAGFTGDFDSALKKAKDEKKLVLMYVTPSWFT